MEKKLKKRIKYPVKFSFLILSVSILLIIFIYGCKTVSDVPEDHDVNKGGTMHKTGLTDPENNCTACHGINLTGSGNVPSCFNCHGRNW